MQLLDHHPLLALHENLIPTLGLAVAAGYQLTPWKKAGLEGCRRLESIMDRRGGGWWIAFRAGTAYSRTASLRVGR